MGVGNFDIDDYSVRIERLLNFLRDYAVSAKIEGGEAQLATIKSEVEDLVEQTKKLKDLFVNYGSDSNGSTRNESG